ncbi:protein FAR1-RELATED SEQUENCE 8-like [Apium graveolens]|uniref:protein FAR1-RELATED SEQUENCE 8-like n=1 Tax=Apium graveolens TaxID=4045 RepID=UPI003D7A3468
MNDIVGIRPNKSYRSIVVEAGGPENVPFLEKDFRNFLDKIRRLRLGEGDANAVNDYFHKIYWLTCMSGKAPGAIITNQDMAMRNAIKKVFPLARHRWCLWHIMKKLPEKLKTHKKYDFIKFALSNAVYNSLTMYDFENSWNEMIEKYKL